MAQRLGSLRLLHPFPSAINALLVLGLSLLAGAHLLGAGALALAMLLLQFSIGAANDYFDVQLDLRTKPWKPIPAGLVARPVAALAAAVCGVAALALASLFGTPVLLLASAMLGAGLVYDAWLKPTAFGWLCFAVAFPLLPVYAWWPVSGGLPPRSELLLPLAALAGPALQLANGLVDLERDQLGGVRTLVVRLGRRRSLIVMSLVLVLIHTIAWLTLVGVVDARPASLLPVVLASLVAGLGAHLSSSDRPSRRERGWQAQAVAIALLAMGWLASVLVERGHAAGG